MSDSSGLSGVGFFANWELDLWGRVRAGQAFAEQQYVATQLDAEYARQSIAALVGQGWFLATEARMQRAQATRCACRPSSSSRSPATACAWAAATSSTSPSRRPAWRRCATPSAASSAVRAGGALARELVGRYPRPRSKRPRGSRSGRATFRSAAVGAHGAPSRRRCRGARVAGAFYRTEEAKAARLPRITLTASLTSISSELFVLKSTDNPLVSLGASLLQPIFLGGQLQAQVEVRTAEQKQAVADYARVSLRAFSEVEDALSNGFALADRETILMTAVRENARGLELANVRYRVGSSDLRGVQQQQLALYSAQVALLRVQAERLVQRVNLHLALGGSFDSGAAPIVGTAR
jgi:outer membrane protein TolC